MINLEFYPVGTERDEPLAYVAAADHPPAKGDMVVLLLEGVDGWQRYRVTAVEYWFDTRRSETVKSAVIVVDPVH